MAEFVHLHVHSEYSLLDGAVRCRSLAERARGLDMRAVALTDHATMFGAITHYRACHEAGLTPILGCEINVAREHPEGAGTHDTPLDHLVLLSENAEGYRNLLRIVSLGHVEPASSAAPSVRLDTVAEASGGLIALSGCMGGVVPQQLLERGPDAARAALDRLRAAMPAGSLYVELQDHGLSEQPVINRLLSDLAADMELPLVATNDCHFAAKADGEAQLYLSCIASGRSYADVAAAHHGCFEMYFKSADEMAQLFRHQPQALSNTIAVAERCQALELELDRPMLPTFPVPEQHDTVSYFRQVAHDGLRQRLDELHRAGKQPDEELFRARLEQEIDVIVRMDFPGYFLIVWDFIRFAKRRGIPVGPGRGSGAGSVVAYAMRITDLDPLEHQLLFERFLNPERVSMPDFDIDFCMDRRDEVIAYVAERYGANSVGQLATFHELKARSVIKDVARAMGVDAPEAQRIANLVPEKKPGQMCTIAEALELEPKLPAAMESDPTVKEIITQAQRLEGLTRHVGMHAAGVVISQGPLWQHVPCFTSGELLVSQYAKNEVEAAGLVKFDFLGLKTLTVIDLAQKLINQRPDMQGRQLDVSAVPLSDPATYELLQSGETTGLFQLESSGMQQLFKDLRPDTFEDIVAAVALYRPGPLGSGMVKDFVDCKRGRQPVAKMHPLVDDLLAPTYGVIVYQEQVMQIAQRMAGYTLGGADKLRRAMGKKQVEQMAQQRRVFIEGAVANGVAAPDAEHIFGLLEYFAGYGFNKSHSAAYAVLTYQTAYLKAHYPVEFLCALLTADREKNDKVVHLIAEGRGWGVQILPPEINQSTVDFTVVYQQAGEAPERAAGGPASRPKRAGQPLRDPLEPKIRFGLGAVRGLGESALQELLAARQEGGKIDDLFDLAQRVDVRRLNRGVLEALVQCGAMDATLKRHAVSRAMAFASIDRVLERGRSASRDRECGQTSLFGLLQPQQGETTANEYVPHEPWDLGETLRREKQALGFYVSGHPLDRYGAALRRFRVVAVTDLAALARWARVRVAGTVEGYRERVFRSGGKAAYFTLEDLTGGVEVKARERQIERCRPVLTSAEPVLLTGKLQFRSADDDTDDATPGAPMLLLDDAELLGETIAAETHCVVIELSDERTAVEQIHRLAELLRTSPGTCRVEVVIRTAEGDAVLQSGKDLAVEPSASMLAGLERLFGAQVAVLK